MNALLLLRFTFISNFWINNSNPKEKHTYSPISPSSEDLAEDEYLEEQVWKSSLVSVARPATVECDCNMFGDWGAIGDWDVVGEWVGEHCNGIGNCVVGEWSVTGDKFGEPRDCDVAGDWWRDNSDIDKIGDFDGDEFSDGDLVKVGGFSEWDEIGELGKIGDFSLGPFLKGNLQPYQGAHFIRKTRHFLDPFLLFLPGFIFNLGKDGLLVFLKVYNYISK